MSGQVWKPAVLIALALAVAVPALMLSAHSKSTPHKKLFDKRWYHQVEGGFELTTSQVWLECDASASACGNKWSGPFSTSINAWNAETMAVEYDLRAGQNEEYDTNVVVQDLLLDEPGLLGIDITLDSAYELCLEDCTVWYEVAFIGDDGHSGPYGTTSARKGTILHELGHGLSLRHESVNADESVLYDCGEDNRGEIPHSLMAYNCIDPISVGGEGETFVHSWDVCGVNHAYHDSGVGYADCTAAPPAPTPTLGPTPEGGLIGDGNCNGQINAIDASIVLQYSAGRVSVLPCHSNADANGNGIVNTIDATLVLQYTAGYLDELPP